MGRVYGKGLVIIQSDQNIKTPNVIISKQRDELSALGGYKEGFRV